MEKQNETSRRTFIKATTATAALAAIGGNFAFAQASDRIKVGLIGCGGRGTGSARDSMAASKRIVIHALGDLFEDRLTSARDRLSKTRDGQPQAQFDAPAERCFSGFDAYQKVINSGVDLVILASPPGFRPMHIHAAVEAGKHIFAEKPVAVDPTGIRAVLAATEQAKAKKLGFVAGTQRRHQKSYVETAARIKDGAIGEIVAGQCYWNQGGLWLNKRQPNWSDAETQIRNWLYYTWLSGDHIVEQHIHQIDVMNWFIGAHPISAYGMGGRQVRTDPAYGHIYDHFAVEYEYPNGVRVMSMCRQIDGTDSNVSERLLGTAGGTNCDGHIWGKNTWEYDGEAPFGPYVQEHVDLINSIESGNPLNEGRQICESNLAAIMGRMSAYTGKVVKWEQAMNSKLDLMPPNLNFGPLPTPPVAVPGKEPLV